MRLRQESVWRKVRRVGNGHDSPAVQGLQSEGGTEPPSSSQPWLPLLYHRACGAGWSGLVRKKPSLARLDEEEST